eukprot:Lithocolla_globosa_v1_NODE_825_length_3226_cov_19.169032.p5 type:complete len:106 gc:universal NODE_825_length_3226_cov_19.169032:2450-2133(-)
MWRKRTVSLAQEVPDEPQKNLGRMITTCRDFSMINFNFSSMRVNRFVMIRWLAGVTNTLLSAVISLLGRDGAPSFLQVWYIFPPYRDLSNPMYPDGYTARHPLIE